VSRIGKLPVPVPAGVRVTAEGNTIEVTGPRGTLRRTLPSCLSIDVRDTEVILQRASDSKTDRTLHGTMRALVHNMVEGVSKGFEKVLEIEGVGYRVRAEKFGVLFELGHSHPILLFSPEGISISVTTPTELRVNGNDKELVGLTAAKIRSFRPPEVYTGKGIRYRGEHIRRKAGKGGART
jgi:large subunit ribosomal protein L6